MIGLSVSREIEMVKRTNQILAFDRIRIRMVQYKNYIYIIQSFIIFMRTFTMDETRGYILNIILMTHQDLSMISI